MAEKDNKVIEKLKNGALPPNWTPEAVKESDAMSKRLDKALEKPIVDFLEESEQITE